MSLCLISFSVDDAKESNFKNSDYGKIPHSLGMLQCIGCEAGAMIKDKCNKAKKTTLMSYAMTRFQALQHL